MPHLTFGAVLRSIILEDSVAPRALQGIVPGCHITELHENSRSCLIISFNNIFIQLTLSNILDCHALCSRYCQNYSFNIQPRSRSFSFSNIIDSHATCSIYCPGCKYTQPIQQHIYSSWLWINLNSTNIHSILWAESILHSLITEFNSFNSSFIVHTGRVCTNGR